MQSSENDVPKLLRFRDLRDRGIADSPQALRHLQLHEGFPLGRLLGPATRVFTADEVNAWLSARPVEPSKQTRVRVEKSLTARRQLLDQQGEAA
jgi:hypothetical protein